MNNLPIGYLDNDCERNITVNMGKILNTVDEVSDDLLNAVDEINDVLNTVGDINNVLNTVDELSNNVLNTVDEVNNLSNTVGDINNNLLTFSKLNYRKDFFEDTTRFETPVYSARVVNSSTGEQNSFTSRAVLRVDLYQSVSGTAHEQELIQNWLNSKRFYYVVNGLSNSSAQYSSIDKARELWVEVKFSRIEQKTDGTYKVSSNDTSTNGYVMIKLLPAQRTTASSFYNFVLTIDNTDNDFDIYLSPLTKGYESSNTTPRGTTFNIDYITCEGIKPLLSINNTTDNSGFVGLIPTTVYFYFYTKDETSVANVSTTGTHCTVYMDK